MNWHDLRYLLAIGRTSSIAEVSRRLRVDPSTISRRLAALELALGVKLLERENGRVALTSQGGRLFAHALTIEHQVQALLDTANSAATGADLVSIVRISAVPIIVNHLLAPALPLLPSQPSLRLDLIADPANVRFDRREVDLALRFGRPEHGAASVRRLAVVDYATYRAVDTPADAGWIVFGEDLSHLPHADAVARASDRDGIALVARDAETMLAAAIAGAGRALLPAFVADNEPQLERAKGVELTRDLWLVAHSSSRHTPHVTATIDWLKRAAAIKLKRQPSV